MKKILFPALWGGLFIFLVSAAPGINLLNCICGAGIIAGGVFGVYLHQRSLGLDERMKSSDAVAIGLISGCIGAVLSFVTFIFLLRFFDIISYNLTLNSTNDSWSDWQSFVDPVFFSKFAVLFLFALYLVINVLLASIGGLLGFSILGRGKSDKDMSSDNRPSDENHADGIVVEKDRLY